MRGYRTSELVPVLFSFANLANRADSDEILNFMIERSPGQDYYRMGPPPPGTIRNAAFGLLTFANVAGDVASIASLLWLGYAESIAPRKKERNSGILIMIGGTRGTQVWLGADVLDRNDFEGAFISGVTKEGGSAENAERII